MIETASDELIAEIERKSGDWQLVGSTAVLQLISRLRKEQEDKAVMARALEPFSAAAEIFDHTVRPAPTNDEDTVYQWQNQHVRNGEPVEINVGDFRRARAAIKGPSNA